MRPRYVFDELKGACPHDIPLVPVGILLEEICVVNKVPRRCQVGQKGWRGPLEVKYGSVVAWCLYGFHHRIGSFAGARNALRGKDDLVVGGLDVLRRQQGSSVVELDPFSYFEGIGKTIL